jgi:metallo-beta-lactamase class B
MQLGVKLAYLALGLALLASPTAAQAPAAPSALPASWTQPVAPFRVIDNVYYVGSAGLSAWLIKTPKGLILLDVGVPANADLVENNVETLAFACGT